MLGDGGWLLLLGIMMIIHFVQTLHLFRYNHTFLILFLSPCDRARMQIYGIINISVTVIIITLLMFIF